MKYDYDLFREYNAGVERARDEYELHPITHHGKFGSHCRSGLHAKDKKNTDKNGRCVPCQVEYLRRYRARCAVEGHDWSGKVDSAGKKRCIRCSTREFAT